MPRHQPHGRSNSKAPERVSRAPTPKPLPLGHGKRCLPSALDAAEQVFIKGVGSITAATLVCEERCRGLASPPIAHRGRLEHRGRRAAPRCPCTSEHRLHESRQSPAPVLGRVCQLGRQSPAWPPLGPARLLCSSRVPILELIQCERRSVLLRGPHDTRSEAFARLNRPPASNCSIFSGWRGQTLVRFSYCSGAVRAADCS
jgi:hypothetical protein